MSRTRFFDRFTELVGEPPAKYLARWRSLVADLLRQRNLSTSEIAERVGYTDEDALALVEGAGAGEVPGVAALEQAVITSAHEIVANNVGK